MITTKRNQQAQKRHITHHYVINNKNETSTLTLASVLCICSPDNLMNKVSLLFLGVQGKRNYFSGSISLLEIFLWAHGSYPSLSNPFLNMYEYPLGPQPHFQKVAADRTSPFR